MICGFRTDYWYAQVCQMLVRRNLRVCPAVLDAICLLCCAEPKITCLQVAGAVYGFSQQHLGKVK